MIITVQEIEAAIQTLTAAERHLLARKLPTLLPELDRDAGWEALIRDARPRPALTALLDQIDAEFQRNPGAFPAR